MGQGGMGNGQMMGQPGMAPPPGAGCPASQPPSQRRRAMPAPRRRGAGILLWRLAHPAPAPYVCTAHTPPDAR